MTRVQGGGLIRILGIDPGSQRTGYGCIEWAAGRMKLVSHGTLVLNSKTENDMHLRLLRLHRELSRLIELHQPHVLAVENVFFAKNAVSALKLGQARGVVVLTAALFGLELHEYSATQVKRSITGHGGADKEQVSKMLQLQFGSQGFDTPDASDGLALAVHHAFSIALGSRPIGLAAKELKEALSPKRRSKSLSSALKHKIKPISR